MEAQEKIVEILKNSNKPLRAVEIATLASLEKSVVDKSIKKLVKDEKIYSPVRCCYSVKNSNQD